MGVVTFLPLYIMRECNIFQVLDTNKVPHDVAAIFASHDQLCVISVFITQQFQSVNKLIKDDKHLPLASGVFLQ